MIPVLLVDDHTSFREALALAIGQESDLVVAAQAESLAEARQVRTPCRVAVVALPLPDSDALGLVRELSVTSPEIAVLVLTSDSSLAQRAKAVEAGASAVLTERAHLGEILAALHRLAGGEMSLSPPEAVGLLRLASELREGERQDRAALARLTPREREVLQLLADGLGENQVSEHLNVSCDTVHTHVSHIFSKLGVSSRIQAIRVAARHGVVKID